ncbi:MAG: DUF2905 domain-containing protein [Dehalococcoidales bacterium]
MSSLESIGKYLIVIGIFIAILGIIIMFWNKILLLGKLPGDIFIDKGNFKFFFPITTGIIISVVITVFINIIIKLIGK